MRVDAFVRGALVVALLCAADAGAVENRVILGRVEYVVMQDVDLKMKARIDSGAGVSSIDAKILGISKGAQADQERVRFELKDSAGTAKTLERKIVKWAEIKSKDSRQMIRRPVVVLDFCLGGKRLEGRVNLADRSGFLYPVLIGRNILNTGNFLIDPKAKFLEHPGCV